MYVLVRKSDGRRLRSSPLTTLEMAEETAKWVKYCTGNEYHIIRFIGAQDAR